MRREIDVIALGVAVEAIHEAVEHMRVAVESLGSAGLHGFKSRAEYILAELEVDHRALTSGLKKWSVESGMVEP